jgi:predicted nucleic acid-binding protein
VLDTSVFIAEEGGRPIDAGRLPDEAAVSVVTLAELELGVHMARDEATRADRLATLRAVTETYVALPVDADVASAFSRLAAQARREGRRPRIQDTWIAATAVAHRAAVFTRDADFDDLRGVEVIRV